MKRIIRLTENDIKNIVKNSVKHILREYDFNDDLETFDDSDVNVENETVWWSPEQGFSQKPTTDGVWVHAELKVNYSYHSDGQMTDFGWHEDGSSTPESCEISDLRCYENVGGKLEDITTEIEDDVLEQYAETIENEYLS